MSANPKRYERITDEYYALFESFKRSGFNNEQAFELVKAHCNSVNTQNILEANKAEYGRSKRSAIYRRYENKPYTTSEENTEDSES